MRGGGATETVDVCLSTARTERHGGALLLLSCAPEPHTLFGRVVRCPIGRYLRGALSGFCMLPLVGAFLVFLRVGMSTAAVVVRF